MKYEFYACTLRSSMSFILVVQDEVWVLYLYSKIKYEFYACTLRWSMSFILNIKFILDLRVQA
jgi:hypothetical protein